MRSSIYKMTFGVWAKYAYIADLSVMSAPGICQLPFAVFVVPDLHPMIGGRGENAIAIEIKLGDNNQIAVARVKVGESRHLRSRHQSIRPTSATKLCRNRMELWKEKKINGKAANNNA